MLWCSTKGRIAASGTPSSLGGRDMGKVAISFTMPEGIAVADLPVTPSCLRRTTRGNRHRLRARSSLAIDHWALEEKVSLAGLCVMRQTLEDVYLRLTHEP